MITDNKAKVNLKILGHSHKNTVLPARLWRGNKILNRTSHSDSNPSTTDEYGVNFCKPETRSSLWERVPFGSVESSYLNIHQWYNINDSN